MNSLEEVLNFMIKKRLEIILDSISEDFSIDREKLDKYILIETDKMIEISVDKTKSQPINLIGDGICQGKTKKGASCPNKAKPDTNFCGKHS
jgi:poly(3-hydroxyalkanoate) synthetase